MLFYYSYLEDVYGVVEKDGESYLVEMLKTGEQERITQNWLQEKIEDDQIDISKHKDSLVHYKKTYLHEALNEAT